MGLSSRTSWFFGNPSPGKTFGDVARRRSTSWIRMSATLTSSGTAAYRWRK